MNEVAKLEETSVIDVSQMRNNALAMSKATDEFGLSASDIRIATLLLMQPASGLVSDQKAKLGDIVNNESEAVIGGIDKPIEVIALYKYETIRAYRDDDGAFVKELPYDHKKVEREGTEQDHEGNQVAVRRYHTLNFFLLLTKDIENGECFPVLMRFKSTSFQAGSKFASYLFKKKMFKKLPFHQTAILSVERNQNEKKQNWSSLSFKEGRPTTQEEQEIAKSMVEIINAKKYTLMDAEDSEVAGDGPSAKPTVIEAEVGEASGPY